MSRYTLSRFVRVRCRRGRCSSSVVSVHLHIHQYRAAIYQAKLTDDADGVVVGSEAARFILAAGIVTVTVSVDVSASI